MRVELTSGGGAFPVVWGSAVSSPIGVWGSFATFTMLKSQNIIIIKVGGGGGGGAVHFRSDMKSGGGGGGGGGGQSASGRMPFFGTQKIRYRL